MLLMGIRVVTRGVRGKCEDVVQKMGVASQCSNGSSVEENKSMSTINLEIAP